MTNWLNTNAELVNEGCRFHADLCAWTPSKGSTFRCSIATTFVNGALALHDGKLDVAICGAPLEFAQ